MSILTVIGVIVASVSLTIYVGGAIFCAKAVLELPDNQVKEIPFAFALFVVGWPIILLADAFANEGEDWLGNRLDENEEDRF